jgi:hypothetical protein
MAFRVNIRRLKQLIWLACVLALVYAGWTFFEIYSAKQEGRYSARKLTYYDQVLRQEVNESDRLQRQKVFYEEDRYQKLWETLVSGERREVEQPIGPEEESAPPEIVIPDLATILEVGLVLYSSEPYGRFIAIRYLDEGEEAKDGKRRRLHLAESDPLKPPYDAAPYNGEVLRIGLQEVTFAWGGEEVTLTPELGTRGEGVPLNRWNVDESEDLLAGYDAAPERSVQIAPGHWLMGTEDIEQVATDPHRFLSEDVNLRTITPPEGGRSFLEITDVAPGSIVASYGAQQGDRIISVNGIPMNSVPGAIAWFKQNPDLPSYTVVYERAGKEQSTTIHVK